MWNITLNIKGGSNMEVNIFQVDAFSSSPFGGNPAVVVPDAKWISDADKQRIANEMNVSETVFVHQLGEDWFKVTYFTPKCEVGLCGHGTIAVFYTMAEMGYIKAIDNGKKTAYMETNVGRLPVEISYKNGKVDNVIMEQGLPQSFGQVDEISKVLRALNLKMEDIGVVDSFYEPEITSTGLRDLMIPVKSQEILDRLNVCYCDLENLCIRLGIDSVHVFYLPELNAESVYVRNFAPSLGIREESATGTANGALVYYLTKHSLIDRDMLTAIQGTHMGRPSKIYCYIEKNKDAYKVKIGGKANIIMEGILKF